MAAIQKEDGFFGPGGKRWPRAHESNWKAENIKYSVKNKTLKSYLYSKALLDHYSRAWIRRGHLHFICVDI